jgi:hypothetical protein
MDRAADGLPEQSLPEQTAVDQAVGQLPEHPVPEHPRLPAGRCILSPTAVRVEF